MINQEEYEEFIKILSLKSSKWVHCKYCRNKVKVDLDLDTKVWLNEWFTAHNIKK